MQPTSKPLPKRMNVLPAVKRPYPGKDADFNHKSTNGPIKRRKLVELLRVPPPVPKVNPKEPIPLKTFKWHYDPLKVNTKEPISPISFQWNYAYLKYNPKEPISPISFQRHDDKPKEMKSPTGNKDQNTIPIPKNTKNVIIHNKYTQFL